MNRNLLYIFIVVLVVGLCSLLSRCEAATLSLNEQACQISTLTYRPDFQLLIEASTCGGTSTGTVRLTPIPRVVVLAPSGGSVTCKIDKAIYNSAQRLTIIGPLCYGDRAFKSAFE